MAIVARRENGHLYGALPAPLAYLIGGATTLGTVTAPFATIGIGAEAAHRLGWIEPDGFDVAESALRGTLDGLGNAAQGTAEWVQTAFEAQIPAGVMYTVFAGFLFLAAHYMNSGFAGHYRR